MTSYLIEVLQDGCKLPAWGTPVGREVEADNLFASQGISSSDLSQLGALLQSFSIDQIHCDFGTLQQNKKCDTFSDTLFCSCNVNITLDIWI